MEKIKKKCKICGKEFEVYPSLDRIKYCSRKCYGQSLIGHIPWNKGIKAPTISEAKKGHIVTKETRIKIGNTKRKKGYIQNGYRVIKYSGKGIKESHLVWREHNNYMPIPKGFLIHHINQDKLDNRIENLILLPRDFHAELHWEMERNVGINRHKKQEVLI